MEQGQKKQDRTMVAQPGSQHGGGEVLDSGNIWKAEPIRLADGLGTGCGERAELNLTSGVCPEHLAGWSRFLLK